MERRLSLPLADGDPRQEVLLRFALFLAADGRVFASAASEMPEGGPGRPVFRAEEIGSRHALDLFLDAFDPAAGWSWIAADPAHGRENGERLAALATRLVRGFSQLAAGARSGAPVVIEASEHGDTR